MASEYQVFHFFNNLTNLKEITLLEQASFANPWSCESLNAEISNPLNLTSIISLRSAAGSTIAGYGLTRIISPEAELLRIAVAPELRGRGVATKLLGKILQELPAFIVEKVYLEVSEKNCPAISLYQKAGFTNIGCRTNYYDDGTTKAMLFTVDLHR
jgi:ribosomal-protein-alanine N-acetyltransferase